MVAAVEIVLSRFAPNSLPRGLRGPSVGISPVLEGVMVGKGALRGRGERRGEEVGEIGEMALRVRRREALWGERDRLVVRLI